MTGNIGIKSAGKIYAVLAELMSQGKEKISLNSVN